MAFSLISLLCAITFCSYETIFFSIASYRKYNVNKFIGSCNDLIQRDITHFFQQDNSAPFLYWFVCHVLEMYTVTPNLTFSSA